MQCYSCKEFGHIACNCGKKFYNYCKQHGQIVKECSIRPKNWRARAFQAVVPNLNIGSTSTTTSTNQPILTLEMVQQMIFTAFSTFALQGQGKTIFSPWFVNSRASKHMIGSPNLLHNL
ncbi:hypothetical protein L6164_026322 [Bauhinia variegata]|uniref:Uncharacterized protein n=1 Tax=Bauhinia variegata TaxID=167791 RepID=A0ACB9LPS1_BAUVA|nr:hypothetical protein L6164_026322 [Bauhinia variegata]